MNRLGWAILVLMATYTVATPQLIIKDEESSIGSRFRLDS